MKRWTILVAVVTGMLVVGTSGAAVAEPSTDTTGCQTVAGKYLNEEAPGHQGVMTAGSRTGGEGPCGFGDPPSAP